MITIRVSFQRSRLPILLVLCILALTATSVYASSDLRPQAAVTIIGDPDAAVMGKLAVGSASPGSKALTVAGVIDFVGEGTVHNYFTQGPGNNMQVRSNVDEFNAIDDFSKSQWNMVIGSALDQFSIRRSSPGGPYNEDALFFIDGATGNVGIATVDTANGASIPFTPHARLHVETASGAGIYTRGGGGSAADVILGGSGGNTDGRILTDPVYSSSDMHLVSNDAVVFYLDNDSSGEDADFEIRNRSGNLIFNLDESAEMSLLRTDGVETVEIQSSEDGSDGSQITLRDAGGTAAIILDAEYAPGGAGRITTQVLEITGGSDLSELFEIQPSQSGGQPAEGFVVCISEENSGMLEVCGNAYNPTVVGVISGAGDVNTGLLMSQEGSEVDGQFPVALAGRVYVWADASYSPINLGDLLTTSNSFGHAMRALDPQRSDGAILGKAMTPLAEGRGLVLVLVSLQ